MDLKLAVIEKLRALKDVADAEPKQVRDLMNEWTNIGHVPFKEKEKLYTAYKELVDYFFETLDMKGQRARLNNFREKVKNASSEEGAKSMGGERQKLQRQLERLQNDLKTYENNLGFLNAKSKGGNGMLALMERKKQDLKAEIEEIKAKINILDE